MRTIPCIVFNLLLLTHGVFARIGETVEQTEARYGRPFEHFLFKPFQTAARRFLESPRAAMKFYKKNGLIIVVSFIDNRSHQEEIFKEELLTSKSSKEIPALSLDEAKSLLEANSFGATWTLRQIGSTTVTWSWGYGKMTAAYAVTPPMFYIQAAQYEAFIQELDRQAGAKERNALSGF